MQHSQMAHMHIALLPILLILLTHGNTINAGITRQLDTILPIRERITRSVGFDVEEDAKTLETIRTEDNSNSKHRHLDRPARSVSAPEAEDEDASHDRGNRIARDASNVGGDDLQTSADSIVFKPLFRRRQNHKRLRREAPSDDMQTAENNIVFRPLFRKRQNIRRFRRDAPDDLQTSEKNIVRPLFSHKPIRRVRSAEANLVENYSADVYEDHDGQSDSVDSGISDESDYEVDESSHSPEEARVRRETGNRGK